MKDWFRDLGGERMGEVSTRAGAARLGLVYARRRFGEAVRGLTARRTGELSQSPYERGLKVVSAQSIASLNSW